MGLLQSLGDDPIDALFRCKAKALMEEDEQRGGTATSPDGLQHSGRSRRQTDRRRGTGDRGMDFHAQRPWPTYPPLPASQSRETSRLAAKPSNSSGVMVRVGDVDQAAAGAHVLEILGLARKGQPDAKLLDLNLLALPLEGQRGAFNGDGHAGHDGPFWFDM